jgi:hypothetical protein
MKSVYSAVRTGPLNKVDCAYTHKGDDTYLSTENSNFSLNSEDNFYKFKDVRE